MLSDAERRQLKRGVKNESFTTHQIANGKNGGRLPYFDDKWLTNGHFFIGAKEPVAAEILKKSSANFPMPPDWSDMCSGWIMGRSRGRVNS